MYVYLLQLITSTCHIMYASLIDISDISRSALGGVVALLAMHEILYSRHFPLPSIFSPYIDFDAVAYRIIM